MKVFVGTLLSSIKQVTASYVFDEEHGIALHSMQVNQASSRGEGEVSWFSSMCGGTLGYIFKLHWGWPFKTSVCSAKTGLLSRYERILRNLFEAWQGNKNALQCQSGDPGSLSTCHRDNGIPINFQEESGIVTFWNTEIRMCLE